MESRTSLKAKDSTLKAKAKTKDFKIVLEDPQGRGLELDDSNTVNWGFAPSPLGGLSKYFFLPLKNFQRHRRATHSATDGNVNICTKILTTF